MKTHRIILFIIFLLGTVVFETKAQNNNIPERNWSQWSEWNSFECAKKLFFRIRYYETSSKGLYNWQVEFKNDYSEDLYFKYGLEESYKTHKIYGAESVQPIKANSTYISDNHHYVWQTNTNKFNEVDVYIFHVCMGRGNWEQTYPKYYSECILEKKTQAVKWRKFVVFCYSDENGKIDGPTKNTMTNEEEIVVFEDNLIRIGPNGFTKINSNLYGKECHFGKNEGHCENGNEICCEGHFIRQVKIISQDTIEVKYYDNYKCFKTYDYGCEDRYYIWECTLIYTRNHSEMINKGRDENVEFSNDSNIQIFSGSIYLNEGNERNGIFKDVRDGKEYKTIKIGNQEWMAENLAYKPASYSKSNPGYFAYDYKPENASIYGYLYNWKIAQNVCPQGWHLPSDKEWEYFNELANNNINAFNFIDKLGGEFDIDVFEFSDIDKTGCWFSSTVSDDLYIWCRAYNKHSENMRKLEKCNRMYLSVRCIKD